MVISDDVLLDEDTPSLGSVTVNAGGSLVFSPEGDVTLTTNYLLLHGALHIGSEDCPYTAKARIVLTGESTSCFAFVSRLRSLLVSLFVVLKLQTASKRAVYSFSR